MINDKLKVLWVSFNPPTQKASKGGGGTFNYYFKSLYEDKRFDIKLIALVHNNDELYKINEKDKYLLYNENSIKEKINKLINIESRYNPWNRNANMISNYAINFIKKSIRNILKEGFCPDVVILEWTQCVVLAKLIARSFPTAKLVASEHDISYIGYQRKADKSTGLIKKLYMQYKAKHLKKVELNSLNGCSIIYPHNPDNIDVLIREGVPKERVKWLCPYYQKLDECEIVNNRNRDILFFGAMDRPENYLSAIWFIENVMPLLNDFDGIRFVILGSNPPPALKRYTGDRIVVTGFVDSIKDYFENSLCFVAPLVLGAGIKIKVLEALSSGILVLTNDIGIEGIHAENGKHYLFCKTAEDYAGAIGKLIQGDVDITTIGLNAKQLVSAEYDYYRSIAEYKATLTSMGDKK